MNERLAVDMSRCGPWRSAGVELWNVVDRSWCVFARNTYELLRFIHVATEDPRILPTVVNSGPVEASSFWEELDQRLHNQLSSSTSLVDHTRRLVSYYEDDARAFVSEFRSKNDQVRALNQAAFLRDLRNYLLHYGAAPIVVSLSWGRTDDGTQSAQLLKLDAQHLLTGTNYKWKATARQYLEEFGDRDGPVISQNVEIFARAMEEAYNWLFEQRGRVLSINPDRFLIPWPPDAKG